MSNNDKQKELETLFKAWEQKEPGKVSYISRGGEEKEIVINHSNNNFIADGIVDENTWNSANKKRILFVLKEAYGTDWDGKTLATWIENGFPYKGHTIWQRVARWTYGIQNTTDAHIQRYTPRLDETTTHRECLEQIAVLNLKKSGGNKQSDYGEIAAYADYDCEEIRKEISLIDPEIVVCGSTFKTLYEKVYKREHMSAQEKSDNWYYYINLDGKERLYLDVYHPSNRWPDLMNYYMVTNVYQQALIEKAHR